MERDRITVTEAGIEIHHAARRSQPGWTSVWPWEEMGRVVVYGIAPPLGDDDNTVAMDIDCVWGEYETVYQSTGGFAQAVDLIAQRAGIEAPDVTTLQPDQDVDLWRHPLLP